MRLAVTSRSPSDTMARGTVEIKDVKNVTRNGKNEV